MAMTLALVSGSVLAGPIQWNSVDNLVTASGSIATTLDKGIKRVGGYTGQASGCLLYTSPSPRDVEESRMPSSA